MNLSAQIIALARETPLELRAAFVDDAVVRSLNDIGVLPKVLQLHAPKADARKTTGLGPTLCGRQGTRHALVSRARRARECPAPLVDEACNRGATPLIVL